jgi:hypothetical protein
LCFSCFASTFSLFRQTYDWILANDPHILVPLYTSKRGSEQRYDPGCGICVRKRSERGRLLCQGVGCPYSIDEAVADEAPPTLLAPAGNFNLYRHPLQTMNQLFSDYKYSFDLYTNSLLLSVAMLIDKEVWSNSTHLTPTRS